MNKRCQQWGVFKDERLPFMTIAKINNITLSCLYSRWKRDNCPENVDHLVYSNEEGKSKKSVTVDGIDFSSKVEAAFYVGIGKARFAHIIAELGGTATKEQILRVCDERNKKKIEKLKACGEAHEKTINLEGHGPVTFKFIASLFPDSKKAVPFYRARFKSAGFPDPAPLIIFAINEIKPVRKEYVLPTFLPDIPFADLIHLSSTKNTGAGRGEMEDISYSGMKAIQAVRFLGIER